MQRFLKQVVIGLSVLLSTAVCAQVVSTGDSTLFETNVVRVIVADQSDTQRRRALTKAFRQAVLKTSGDRAMFDAKLWRALERNAVSLLKAYQYEMDGNDIVYVATFDKEKLQTLLQQNGLPIWDERRPDSLLWLTLFTPASDENIVVTDFDREREASLFHTINTIAQERGVAIGLPLMDIEDAQLVTAYDIWGRFIGPIELASARYNIDHIITARVKRAEQFDELSLRERLDALAQAAEFERLFEQENQNESLPEVDAEEQGAQTQQDIDLIVEALLGEETQPESVLEETSSLFNIDEFSALLSALKPYALDYSYVFAGQVKSGTLIGDTPEDLVVEMINHYIDTLSQYYALKTDGEQGERPLYQMTIENVGSLEAYTRVYQILDNLSMVGTVQLKSVSNDTAVFELDLLSDQQRLIDALVLDGSILPGLDSFGNVTDTQVFTWTAP